MSVAMAYVSFSTGTIVLFPIPFTQLKSQFLAIYSNEAGYFLMTVYGSFIPVSNVTGFGADVAV